MEDGVLVSRPYRPAACCEACVFGRGEHAEWCPTGRPDSDEEWQAFEAAHGAPLAA